MSKSFKKWLMICFVGVLLTLCFHYFISKKIDFVAHSKGYLKIQDYAYYIIIAKAFWFKGLGNVYELHFQQQALSAHIGAQICTAMPLGITPIALVVWFPFAYLARFSMSLSYTVWIAVSGSVLITALWRIARYVFQRKKPQILPITLSLVTVFSPIMLLTIYFGQTSVLATGLLIHLIYFVYRAENQSDSDINLMIPLIIFFLGIKPTYIALGLGLLIIYGMWRYVMHSLVLIIFVFISITPLLTMKWVLSYFHQLSIFSSETIPDMYSWAFVLHTMNIFRSAFRNMIGDNIASLISTIVTCSIYMAVVGFCLLSKIKGKATDQLSSFRLTKDQLFILLVASYLLFAPYAGGYEDILFLPIFITVLLYGNTPPLTSWKSLTLTFILFVILLHTLFPPNKPLWLFWIFKFTILAYMLHFCRFSSEKNKFLAT